MDTPLADLGFTTRRIPVGSHICYLYGEADDDRLENARRFLDAGGRGGDRLVYIVDTMSVEAFRELIGPVTGSFEVTASMHAYTPTGEFCLERTAQALRDFAATGRDLGHPYCRAVGEMTWALEGFGGTERLIEYERGLTPLLREERMTGICQYDTRRFPGGTIYDVLEVHPYVIARGRLLENPLYLPPEEYLARHRAREHSRAS